MTEFSRCDNCGERNEAGRSFCWVCYAKLGDTVDRRPLPSGDAAPAAVSVSPRPIQRPVPVHEFSSGAQGNFDEPSSRVSLRVLSFLLGNPHVYGLVWVLFPLFAQRFQWTTVQGGFLIRVPVAYALITGMIGGIVRARWGPALTIGKAIGGAILWVLLCVTPFLVGVWMSPDSGFAALLAVMIGSLVLISSVSFLVIFYSICWVTSRTQQARNYVGTVLVLSIALPFFVSGVMGFRTPARRQGMQEAARQEKVIKEQAERYLRRVSPGTTDVRAEDAPLALMSSMRFHGLDNNVARMALYGPDRILLAGPFSFYAGNPVKGLIMIRTDGKLDDTFAAYDDLDINNFPRAILPLPNGDILVGASLEKKFQSVMYKPRLTKLNGHGQIDEAFTERIGTGFGLSGTAEGQDLLLQKDGKIVVTGPFESFNREPRCRYIARIGSDGLPDLEFSSRARKAIDESVIVAVERDSKTHPAIKEELLRRRDWKPCHAEIRDDGRILLSISGALLQMQPDGSLDARFQYQQQFPVGNFKLLPDGGIVFSYYDGAFHQVVRLDAGGNPDSSFQVPSTAFKRGIWAYSSQTDGKILLGGQLNDGYLGELDRGRAMTGRGITRLNSDGSLDLEFEKNIGSGFDGLVNNILTQPDGKIIVGGQFTRFAGKNASFVGNIARLNADGSLDRTFDPK